LASPTGLHFYESKAAGGAASLFIGDAVVDAELGMSNEYHIPLDDPGVWPQLKKLASEIKRHGAVASIEMSHGGNAAGVSFAQGHKIYGPVESETSTFRGEETKHAYEMTPEILKRTIRKYAEAAALAKRCGFEMITLHGGHGWLIHQFMSPTVNTRTDEYGGSFENRMRFPLEIISAVREAVGPGFPIEIRISGAECYEGGYDIRYGVEIAKALDGKVDLIHVSAGSHEDPRVFTVTHPSMFLEDGVNVKYAAEIKKHIKHSKVATVGALSDPALLEEILVTGKADVVELARGLICDPDLPLKARTGKDDDIIHCMRCLTCFSSLMTEGYIVCALNPQIGNEADVQLIKTPARKKTVLVAGGGIGGMQAAISCAKHGHQVILCEKSDRLGGILRCEEKVPFKKHLHEYLEQQARIISRFGIDVRMNTEATPNRRKTSGRCDYRGVRLPADDSGYQGYQTR
jgi:2,4-dienoyl-CoA reductase-like NADH-dependent reductase (Old Yellow Enzyme family)